MNWAVKEHYLYWDILLSLQQKVGLSSCACSVCRKNLETQTFPFSVQMQMMKLILLKKYYHKTFTKLVTKNGTNAINTTIFMPS